MLFFDLEYFFCSALANDDDEELLVALGAHAVHGPRRAEIRFFPRRLHGQALVLVTKNNVLG
jgi:hypothetical protein